MCTHQTKSCTWKYPKVKCRQKPQGVTEKGRIKVTNSRSIYFHNHCAPLFDPNLLFKCKNT